MFIIPKYKKREKLNMEIESEIKKKLEEKGIKVRKVFIERVGHPDFGEFSRSIVLIEGFDRKLIKSEDFGIDNCWVLTDR